jgi:hypothetical protein
MHWIGQDRNESLVACLHPHGRPSGAPVASKPVNRSLPLGLPRLLPGRSRRAPVAPNKLLAGLDTFEEVVSVDW